MHSFDNQKKSQTGGSEDEALPGQFSREPPDEEMEGEPSEEELIAQVEEFNRAEGVPDFPDEEDEESEEIPELSRSRWMARVASCLMGTFLAVAIAGLLVNGVAAPRQARMFLIYLLVLAPLFSLIWFLILRPQRPAKNMDEQSTNPVESEPIHPK
jgi:hypothetical protein